MGKRPTLPDHIIKSTHPDYPNASIDLSEFASGAPDEKSGQGSHMWAGGFKGRPGLIEDLLPVLRSQLSRINPTGYGPCLNRLRKLYRFLDRYERTIKRKGAIFQPVERLHHLTGAHLDLMSKHGPAGEWEAADYPTMSRLRTLVLDAVFFHELPELNLPALSRPRGLQKDMPDTSVAASFIRFLRGEVLAVFGRWHRTDALAASGRSLFAFPNLKGHGSDGGSKMSEADAHATFRELCELTGHVLPTIQMLRSALGLKPSPKLPHWWPHYGGVGELPKGRVAGNLITWSDLSAGVYPTTGDVMSCILLCLGRSAWNPGTMSALDISNWHSRYDDRAIWVFSRKWRAGGAYQYTVSSERDRTGVYGVVNALIERSGPLRTWLARNRDAHSMPDVALRSPWLGINDRVNLLLFAVDPGKSQIINRHLKEAIDRYNEKQGADAPIGDMSCTDFRDIAADWTYRRSRYSMWITLVLLGHKSLSTTRSYVTTRAARNESHAAVKSVLDDVFLQIFERRQWDPTLTRAAVEGVDLSDDAMSRLSLYRSQMTYDGCVCANPFNPPRDIDPGNPLDGKTRCIQGHRCAAKSCPLAYVFEESLPWLARRTAELEWIEQEVGTVRFSTSSEKDDLTALRKTLSQWPEADVQRELEIWRTKLKEGTHRPLRFAGRR